MKKTTSWHVSLVSVLYSERTSFVGSLFRKWNRALFSRRDCSVPDWTDADAPKCLQSSFVFVATDTSIVLPRLVLFLFHLLLSPTDRILSSLVISLFCLLTFLPRFSTLARASFRSFWPFGERALNCPVVYATVPGKDEENLGTDRDSTRTNGERHENLECTCFEAYASKAGDKQKRSKELVLRIGSQSRNTFARDIDRLCLFFPRNECVFSYILRENKKHAGIQVNSHS